MSEPGRGGRPAFEAPARLKVRSSTAAAVDTAPAPRRLDQSPVVADVARITSPLLCN